jgi:alpha/beta superfamily hydrolase
VTFHLTTADGLRLDALWDAPDDPGAAIVFCHPHPLHGGSMRAPLVVKAAARLVELGFGVLRFDFRGVGGSEGHHDHGVGERLDIDSAWSELTERAPGLRRGIVGWSFGAATSLNWVVDRAVDTPWVGIAPPVTSDRTPDLPTGDTGRGRKAIVVGDRDQFVSPTELAAYAAEVGAELHVMPGSDHFFYFREQRLADLVADGLRP